jgi:site-specific DNA-methyltransferase (adenine-specific)
VDISELIDQIHHMKAEDLLIALPDASIDMILTSPPYDNLRSYRGFAWDFEFIAHQSYRVLKPGGVLVWVVGDATIDGSETLTSFRQALYFVDVCGFKMHDTMIWKKLGVDPPHKLNRYSNMFEYMFVLSRGEPKTANIPTYPQTGVKRPRARRNPDGTMRRDVSGGGGGAYPNVWEIGTGIANRDDYTDHPAVFPQSLAERHILTWSNPGDLVLDFFMGSGTTAKMARNNGRRFIGCDISAEYVDISRKRLAIPYTLNMFDLIDSQVQKKPSNNTGRSEIPVTISMFGNEE